MKRYKKSCRHFLGIIFAMIMGFYTLCDSISVKAKSDSSSVNYKISIKQNDGKILIKFLNLEDFEPDYEGQPLEVNIYICDSSGTLIYDEIDFLERKNGKSIIINGLNSGTYYLGIRIAGEEPITKKVKVKSVINKERKNIKIGDRIQFGLFEQDGNLDNGSEDIEWIVMSVEGDRVLLYSSYILCLKRYSDYAPCTWENSSLRKWLNEEFYTKAFNINEQKCIKKTLIHNENSYGYTNIDGGIDTRDKVFLLPEEVIWRNKFFCIEPGIATEYVKKEWEYLDSYEGYYGFWLLGTSGESNLEAPNMNYLPLHDEEIVYRICSSYSMGINAGEKTAFEYATGGVRPAIYVDINKLRDIKSIKI